MVLKRFWDRQVLKRRTVSEVASDVVDQLNAVKLILFKWFSAEFAKNGVAGPVPDDPEASRRCTLLRSLTTWAERL